MTPRIWNAWLIAVLVSVGSSTEAAPQSANYQLVSDGVISGGETCSDGHARVAASAIGEPITNDVATASFKLSEGHFVTQRHLLLLLPHQAPTVNPLASPTAVTTQTLTGTKAPDTALWLNGSQVIPLNADTTWSHQVTLAEGANVLTILTKDLFGNASATITTAILLDTSPPTIPVVTDDGSSTLVFSQLHAAWTSSDPGSGLAAFEYRIGTTPTGGELIPATSAGAATQITKTGLALVQGQLYYVSVRANNQAGSWSDWGVSDGIYANSSAPVISTFSPVDASKFLHGTTISLSATATDADGDALEYQFNGNGLTRQIWSATSTHDWLTTVSDIGLQTTKVEVRDGHGGSATTQQDVYVLRRLVSPP
ncbi:MAG: hypothetical protein Q8R91_05465 [Candidatus Omnitrophota bacterium]|nr:hypothetical protein [Candidatus Omnitrophota bacterium]